MQDTYKTVCDGCGRPTWYETEQQCHQSVSKSKHCGECGTLTYAENTRCTGTLRLIDRSGLSAQFTPYLHDYTKRLEVITAHGERVRGYVGKTTGWKPAYLLLPRRNSVASSFVLHDDDRIARVISKK
jgi:hypothetical protein